MCGRYAVKDKEVAAAFAVVQGAFEFESYNIAPTQHVPIIFAEDNKRTMKEALWWLVPKWAKNPDERKYPTFNARAETAHEKATFKEPLRHKRCIIPASGFYEWQKAGSSKQPHYILKKDDAPLGFAGLYDIWQGKLLSCTILTTTANKLMATLHNRMPVILKEADYDFWLDPEVTEVEEVQGLLIPFEGELMAYPVSKGVNKATNNGSELLERA